jgi:LysM repeat protein
MHAIDSIAFDERPRGQGPAQAVKHIAHTLEDQGIDAPSALFDEALVLAREGHLGRARDRLRMLLCLDPDDARAHLLLAKVFAAQKKWAEALGEVDTAAACGLKVNKGLRDLLEQARVEELSRAEERTEQVKARQDGELKALRNEARRLRTENTRLSRLARAEQHKAWTWTGVATVMTLVAGAVFLWGGTGGNAEAMPETAVSPEPTATLVEPTTPLHEVTSPVPTDTTSALSVLVAPDPVASTPRFQTYLVKSGDTLGKVARHYYGASARWPELLDANEAVLHGSEVLQIGMELQIPMD